MLTLAIFKTENNQLVTQIPTAAFNGIRAFLGVYLALRDWVHLLAADQCDLGRVEFT